MVTAETQADIDRPGSRVGRHQSGGVLRVLAAFGRLLIIFGVVLLLFVAYQLWGTGLREAASQRDLRAQFEEQLDRSPPESPPGARAVEPEADDAPGTTHGAPEDRDTGPPPSGEQQPVALATAPPRGQAVAILRIPKLDLDKVVVEGTDVASLKKGPGHEPGTALPGMPGNAVIAGHRTTYGAPFYRLDELAPDDRIIVQTPSGLAHYVVTASQVVKPDDVWILEPTGDDRLTLFTCTPRFSAARRLVVTAHLTQPPPATVSGPEAGRRGEVRTAVSTPERPQPVDELGAATGSLPAAATWSAGTVMLAGAVWWAGRRYGQLVAYALGAPVLAIALFTTFERVAGLLPSAV